MNIIKNITVKVSCIARLHNIEIDGDDYENLISIYNYSDGIGLKAYDWLANNINKGDANQWDYNIMNIETEDEDKND